MAFREQFEQLRRRVEEKLGTTSGCHDFDHTLRVLHNAELLAAELPEADRTIVRLAALLHDIARPEEMASRGKLCHAQLGAEMVRSLLAEYGFSPAVTEQVARAVLTHRYRDGRHPNGIEAEIVYDADKLDSLGAVGIGRAFLFAGREHARLHNTAEEALSSEAYSREDTAYREYLVKLRKLPDCMLTLPGRRLAVERAAFMKEFFDRLNAETAVS